MPDFRIEPFDRDRHIRDAFDCGQKSLDDFIRSNVTQYAKRRIGRTFVAAFGEAPEVIGYYTLAASAIEFATLPAALAKKLPKHPVPAILLARLAIDKAAQGKGLGRELLIDALRRSLAIEAQMGANGVIVDAIDETAAAFYRKFDFMPLTEDGRRLFLPMATIEAAVG